VVLSRPTLRGHRSRPTSVSRSVDERSEGRYGTERLRRADRRSGRLPHVRIRGRLLREAPKGDAAVRLPAKHPARIYRLRVRVIYHGDQRRGKSPRQGVLLRLRLGRVVGDTAHVPRGSHSRGRREIRG